MRWHKHVNYISGKTNYLTYVFWRLRHLPSKVHITSYYGLFVSVCIYGIITWGEAYNIILMPIYRLKQKNLNILVMTDEIVKLFGIFLILLTNCNVNRYLGLSNKYIDEH